MELASMYLRLQKTRSDKNETTLREVRKSLGYSVQYVADYLKISKRTLYKYERDPKSIYASTALEIARLYGTTVDELSFLQQH
jgi:predicted transcriptional regulator